MLRLYDNSPQERDYMRILECNEVVLFLLIFTIMWDDGIYVIFSEYWIATIFLIYN